MKNGTLVVVGMLALGISLVGCSSQPNQNPRLYNRQVFATVRNPIEMDFQDDGDLFVGNTGTVGNEAVHVRRVDTEGNVAPFGDEVEDPDALIVDRQGSIATLGPGSILVGGTIGGDVMTGRITEISPDGTTTQTLIEGGAPDLANPSSFAFLNNGDLLIGNFTTNTVTRLDGSGRMVPFYADDPDADSGLISVAHDPTTTDVYISTGSGKLAFVTDSGRNLSNNLALGWSPEAPGPLAVDTYGAFQGDVFVAEVRRGGISRIDPQRADPNRPWTSVRNSNVQFDKIFGMAVSPRDGALYVAESTTGKIWKVTQAR